MVNAKLMICVVTATLGAITPAQTQASQASDAVPVTVENVIHAECDLYLSAAQSDAAMLPTGCLLMAQKQTSACKAHQLDQQTLNVRSTMKRPNLRIHPEGISPPFDRGFRSSCLSSP
jgi:hypothetical protein